MSTEVPVFMTRVECPVCKTVNEYETIKMGAYTEGGRDNDFCPTGRVWRNRKYQHVNPLLYFMVTCSSCFYTREFNKKFKEWKTDSAFRSYRQKTVREKHLNALASPEGLIKPLSAALDQQQSPNETAIVKLLLGIVDENMLERPSYLDLGRWYLRIGWLYREIAGGASATISAEQVQKSRLQMMLKLLRETFARSEKQIDEIKSMVDQFPQVGPPTEDPYRAAVANWRSGLPPIIKSIDDLLSWRGVEGQSVTAMADEGPATLPFGGYPSFNAFMQAMANKYDEIPLNEMDALTLSLSSYIRAYEETRDVSTSNQKIQVAYMIGELARRVGQFDQARQYFNVAIRTGQEFIHANRHDEAKTALARKLADMARDQGRQCTRNQHCRVPIGGGNG